MKTLDERTDYKIQLPNDKTLLAGYISVLQGGEGELAPGPNIHSYMDPPY